MATNTNGIGTWSEINSKTGSSGSPSSKLPTQEEIIATGKANVSPLSTDGKICPRYSFVSKKTINYLRSSGPNPGSEGTVTYTFDYAVASDITLTVTDNVKPMTLKVPKGQRSASYYHSNPSSGLSGWGFRSLSPSSDSTYSYVYYG